MYLALEDEISFFSLFYLLTIVGDALVLIDEADVFLEARNSTEIARNALGKIVLKMYHNSCSAVVFSKCVQLIFFLSFFQFA